MNGSVITSPVFLGANWAAFARDLKEVGGFDPWFGPGSATGSTGQEQTMQRRLLGAGLHGRYSASRGGVALEPEGPVFTALGAAPRVSQRGQIWAPGQSARRHGARVRLSPLCDPSRCRETVRAIVRSVDPRLEARFKARHELLVALGFLKGNRLAHLRSRSS